MKGYTVKSIDTFQTKEWILKKHYAKRMPNIVNCFGLFNNENIIQGVLTMGMPPTPFFNKLFKGDSYLELNRLVVNEGLEKNSLSFFVSQCLKKLNKNIVIVSYADPNNGHTGYIYQATNWIYTGCGRVDENDKRGVNRFFFMSKEYHERHIPDTMKMLKFKVNSKITKNENWINNGGKILKQERKHRYFFVCGDKFFKLRINKILNNHFKTLPYPKGDNKRYNADYSPTVQQSLF